MIDIKKALRDNDISFVEFGSNVAKGNINIHCPMCGPTDKSEHLGIRLSDGTFGCWRNKKHSGRNLARLFQILGIPYVDDKSGILKSLLDRTYFNEPESDPQTIGTRHTELPRQFVPLTGKSILDKPYINYLVRRGFGDYTTQVIKDYDFRRSSIADKWHNRVIIPIHSEDEVTWTGRAIGDDSLRYRSPVKGEAKSIKQVIFNHNELADSSGRALLITEGPLDAALADVYNKADGIRATCLFGLSIPEIQISLLNKVCINFNTILIALDQGTLTQSLQLMRRLERFGPVIMQLPRKDYGEMSPEDNKKLMEKYL